MAIGLKLSSATHDLVYDDGALVLIEGAEEVSRNIKTRLLLAKGEFTLDTSYGFPFRDVLGTHIYNLSELETVVKQYILDTEGVIEFTRFSLDFKKGNERLLIVDFTVNTVFGRLVVQDALDNGSEIQWQV